MSKSYQGLGYLIITRQFLLQRCLNPFSYPGPRLGAGGPGKIQFQQDLQGAPGPVSAGKRPRWQLTEETEGEGCLFNLEGKEPQRGQKIIKLFLEVLRGI